MRRIKFGVVLANRNPIIFPRTVKTQQLLNLAQMADENDYDSVWVGDSVLAKPRLEPFTLLGAVAAQTKKVKVGTACLSSFPLRHPILVAQAWATLDRISGGRTVLGVCMGGGGSATSGEAKKEFQNLGVSYENRASVFEESIEIVRELWTKKSVTYQGKHFKIEDVSLEPKPMQKPSPPVWIASNPIIHKSGRRLTRRAYRRVARLADGWMTMLVTPEQFADGWRNIKAHAREVGKNPLTMESCLYFNVNLNPDREKAYNETKKYLEKYYQSPWTKKMISLWTALGSGKECIAKIEDYVKGGLRNMPIRFTSPNEYKQFERFTEEIVPSF